MKWEDMVKGLGNNGVMIVEGECGEEDLQMLKGRVAKEFRIMEGGRWQTKTYKHGICLPTKCDNKHAHLHWRCIKKIGKMH